MEELQKQIGKTVIAQSGEAFLKDQTLMMQASILLEVARKESRELKGDLTKANGIISIMSDYLDDSLEMFEALFESDESVFNYERMADYVTIARFMEKYKGRPCIADRVMERMRELPFN